MYVEDMDLDEAMYIKMALERRYQEASAGSSEREQLDWDIQDLEGRIGDLSRNLEPPAFLDASVPHPGVTP
ncbi:MULTISPECIES: hypothetical protein [Mycolicibacter]|uniref:Uncharacterized protein n=1 Tax=Mycolicibacter longobardus TaxID=1108812 RepID=A0A1X1YAP3_9MYCO|nr:MULTISPECIES: hypothetical protein [Mycolicibacter]ORW08080.1 hypothetical protein AWC16_20310 [Mycolicibacter longobardus]RAV04274.1 hypothetical protein DQP56_00200 [Mycolicibacter senuensis]